MADGMTEEQIAQSLGIAPGRVKNIVKEIILILPNPHKISGPKLVAMYAIALEFQERGFQVGDPDTRPQQD